MRKTSLSVILLVITFSVFAQSVLDKMPPSPTVASIIKASEITASKYTGSPNISIPLHTVSYHNMQVPISLNYDARGIKVNDVPGWVGTNWSLSAGGVITRQVNGLADDMPVSGYFVNYPLYENNGLTKVAQVREYDRGETDGQPDLFNFSFPGGSGKFMIDHNKKIKVFPHSKIKIQFLNGTTIDDGFKITTIDGTQYTFDEKEITQVGPSGNLPSDSYVSSWYLSKIESPIFPGKSIGFSYDFLGWMMDIVKLKSYSATREYFTGGFFPSGGIVQVIERVASYQTKRLKKIDWISGSVEFIANTTRLDLPEDKRLDEIRIYDHNDALIRKYELGYGYYGGTSQKLRLDTVQEFGNDGISSLPPYLFTYESSDLPAYNSTGQDYWGFNNGKTGNADLLPIMRVEASAIATPLAGHYRIGSADRLPDETHLKKGLLQSIQYPTGGISEFEMENNQYATTLIDYFAMNFQSTLSCSFGVMDCTLKNDFDYLKNTFGNQLLTESTEIVIAEGGGEPMFHTQTKSFTLSDAQYALFEIDIDQFSTTNAYVRLEKDVSGTWTEVFQVTGDGYSNRYEDIAAGDYRLVAYAAGEVGLNPDKATLRATWKVPSGVTDLPGPGLRVRRVFQREQPNGEAINVRRFEYKDAAGSSSGILYAEPVHAYRDFMRDVNSQIQAIATVIRHSSSSAFQYYGAPLGYSRVVEFSGENGENGKIEDIYNANPESILDAIGVGYVQDFAPQQNPFAPAFYAYWDFGQLLESTVYRRESTEYKKVQKTKNIYDFKAGSEVKGLAVASVNVDDLTMEVDLMGVHYYDEVDYKVVAVWEQLVSTEQTTYSPSEEGSTTVSEMTYETLPNHLQVVSRSVTGSDGIKNVTEYTYPLDYWDETNEVSLHPYADGLVANNMHATVIEELSYKDDGGGNRQVIRGKITDYNSYVLQPREIYTLKAGGNTTLFENGLTKSVGYNGSNSLMDNEYELRISFSYYKGNLTQQIPAGGPPMTYLWGYDGQYPIARVQNVGYSDVTTALGGITDFGLGGLSEAQGDILRALPGALTTVLEYQIGYGVHKLFDPNKAGTTYDYDVFGRLQSVKDRNQKIINAFKYHYKGQ